MKTFNRVILVSISLVLLAALTGCDGGGSSGGSGATLTLCSDPRPEICTLDWTPVCGATSNGSTKTYANACNACANKEVVGYVLGECK